MKSIEQLQPLTERQAKVYRWIRQYHARNRFGPSLREVMAHFRYSSPNAVVTHVRPLIKKGWLEKKDNVARSVLPTLESLRHEL
jgi:SOS-response transcriptional repressor LexA